MTKTVVGLFDDFDQAQQVVRELADFGFRREDISLVANDEKGRLKKEYGGKSKDKAPNKGTAAGATIGGIAGLLIGLGALTIPGLGPVLAAGPLVSALAGAGVGAVAGGIVGTLVDLGVPKHHAELYSEGVRRGGTLVTVNTEDDTAQHAVDIMQNHGAVDIERRATEWRQGGWQPQYGDEQFADTGRTTRMEDERMTDRPTRMEDERPTDRAGRTTDETTFPVVEEDLQVGKREVQRGGVRMYTRTTEQPVEKNVTLRDEHVNVDRRPVDRPATDSDMEAFKEGSVEVTETGEEPVVSKQARVVEEVTVNKDVEEHDVPIRDTVRRTDVQTEDLGAQRSGKRDFNDYSSYDRTFRQNYDANFANSGYPYEQVEPAYRYGYTLATDERYANTDWNTMEPGIRQSWEKQYPGTWERFKDAIRYSWDRVRGRA